MHWVISCGISAVKSETPHYAPLLTGASVLPYAGWQPSELAQLVKQHGLTASLMSATHIFDLLRLDPTELDQLRSLNTIAAGGKPDHFFPEFEKITGATILRCHGVSECPIHTMVAAKDRASYGDTEGRTFPGSELQVVGAIGPDDVGEAYVRGPALFLGYFGRPDLTKAATTDDGFYRTGDLVRKDQQGHDSQWSNQGHNQAWIAIPVRSRVQVEDSPRGIRRGRCRSA
jgi:acyl-coenzyme A synthetase/AMP-(fatty) acid ligase